MRRLHKSDAQANAEALARRSATYADEHARSYEVRFDRARYRPRNMRDYVHQLRRAYADEVPSRIHVRETDAGGDPAWSPEFTRYLTGSDGATDKDETYRTPFRAALTSWRDDHRRVIVGRIVLGGWDEKSAAIDAGVPEWCAHDVAFRSLEMFWNRLSDVRMDLARSETAA